MGMKNWNGRMGNWECKYGKLGMEVWKYEEIWGMGMEVW